MDPSLAPCPSCRRHLRITERACPFCGASLDAAELGRGVVPGSTQRLSRAAVFVFGATIAASTASCDGDTQNPGGTSGSVTGAGAGAAGGGGSGDGGDGGAPVPMYGGPHPGVGGAGGTTTTGGAGGVSQGGQGQGGAMPLYGAAPPPDGGPPEN